MRNKGVTEKTNYKNMAYVLTMVHKPYFYALYSQIIYKKFRHVPYPSNFCKMNIIPVQF